jgi:two-component system, cell cycle sensor histidine kinase and response regulator CckA
VYRRGYEEIRMSMKVLLVDDEESIRFLLGHLLSDIGCEVSLASNGEEAVEKIVGHDVDLVVSDIYMPIMDGKQLHRTMRFDPAHAELPFLFMSGYRDDYVKTAVEHPHFEGFYQKGESIGGFIDLVRALGSPTQRDRCQSD